VFKEKKKKRAARHWRSSVLLRLCPTWNEFVFLEGWELWLQSASCPVIHWCLHYLISHNQILQLVIKLTLLSTCELLTNTSVIALWTLGKWDDQRAPKGDQAASACYTNTRCNCTALLRQLLILVVTLCPFFRVKHMHRLNSNSFSSCLF
jgi:hypothetical protein